MGKFSDFLLHPKQLFNYDNWLILLVHLIVGCSLSCIAYFSLYSWFKDEKLSLLLGYFPTYNLIFGIINVAVILLSIFLSISHGIVTRIILFISSSLVAICNLVFSIIYLSNWKGFLSSNHYRWEQLYYSFAVRDIQETYNCCGFFNVSDFSQPIDRCSVLSPCFDVFYNITKPKISLFVGMLLFSSLWLVLSVTLLFVYIYSNRSKIPEMDDLLQTNTDI